MKIIIIEDEEAGANLLESTLKQLDNTIAILGVCENEEQTLNLVNSQSQVDAIFSDIQLTDSLSFEILKKIDSSIPVVFVTAYNEYALEAFHHHGIDYILKPYSRSDIENAVEKLKTYNTGQLASNVGKLENLLNYFEQNKSYKSTFLVGFQDRLIPLNTKDIVCFYTSHSDVYVIYNTGKSYMLTENLEHIEKQLDPNYFFRANRQFIVNKPFIIDIRHYFNGRLKVKLDKVTPEDIIISKAKASEFKKWLGR